MLAEGYPLICEMIAAHHEHAKIPDAGSSQELEWRGALAQIAKVDKFPPQEIIDTLTWLFTLYESDSPSFDWRDQICAMPGLRKRRGPGEPSKFERIHGLWKKYQEYSRPIPGINESWRNLTLAQREEMPGTQEWEAKKARTNGSSMAITMPNTATTQTINYDDDTPY